MGSAFSAHPLLYVLLLAGGVGVGLPMGVAVVGAGALYGGSVGVAVVLIGEAVGMLINWNLCRHRYRRWMVQASAMGTGVIRGSLSVHQQILGLVTVGATLALAAVVTCRLRRNSLNARPNC